MPRLAAYPADVDSEHGRFETLAVGHVLGGLPASDASEFRSHLVGCETCRRRVAELRDIASDLAAAERDERVQARVRTDVALEAEMDAVDLVTPPGIGLTNRNLGVVALLVLLVIAGLGFWNLHMRGQVTVARSGIDRADTTLETFAEGRPVTAELAGSMRGQMVTDGDRFAFALTDVPELGDPERLVVWLLGTEEGDRAVLLADQDDGSLIGAVELEDADGVLITAQTATDGTPREPAGRELLRTDLSPPSG